jgi:hypothetical protein
MRLTRLPLAAALLLSTVAFAQAQVPPSSTGAATTGSGASNSMSHQPAGTVEGSGGTPTGTSNGENAGNRGTGMGMTHSGGMMRHHAMRHHRMTRKHRTMMHHKAAMNAHPM